MVNWDTTYTIKIDKMNSEEDLVRFCNEWDEAMVDNNAKLIAHFMSEDWVCVGTEGGITPKSSFLEWISAGDLIHTRMDSVEMRVRIYENTAVVTSRGTSAGTYREQPFSFHEWSTSIFRFENNKWSCVLTMLTPAKETEGLSL